MTLDPLPNVYPDPPSKSQTPRNTKSGEGGRI